MIDINEIKVRVVVSLLWLSFVLVIGYVLVVYPEYRRAELIKVENISLQTTIAKRHLLFAQITKVRHNLGIYRACYHYEKSKMFRQYNQQQLARAVINIARSNGVTLMESGKVLVRNAGGIIVVSCSFLFLGSFESIIDFIVGLYRSNYFFVIPSFCLTNRANGTLELKMQLDGLLKRVE